MTSIVESDKENCANSLHWRVVSRDYAIVPMQRLFVGRLHPVFIPLMDSCVSDNNVHFVNLISTDVDICSLQLSDRFLCEDELIYLNANSSTSFRNKPQKNVKILKNNKNKLPNEAIHIKVQSK